MITRWMLYWADDDRAEASDFYDDYDAAQNQAEEMATDYGQAINVVEYRFTFDDSELVYTAEPPEPDE